MSFGIFTDKNFKPTIDDIHNALSISKPLFEYLVNYIECNFKTHSELKFYGKNYGWALRFNRSGKSLIALYPGKDEFTAQIILNDKQVLEALNSDISEKAKNIIEKTPEIYEGKWIFIKVNSEVIVKDVEKLILIRTNKDQNME